MTIPINRLSVYTLIKIREREERESERERGRRENGKSKRAKLICHLIINNR